MMLKRLLFTCTFLIIALQGLAQNEPSFRVLETDTSDFPNLQVNIELSQNVQALNSDFVVLDENKDTLQAILTAKEVAEAAEVAGNGSRRSVFVVIDGSSYTQGMSIETFKKSIEQSLSLLGESDVINVGYFGSANEDRILQLLSLDFTSNLSSLKDQIRTQVTASVDTIASYPIYTAMYDAIDALTDSPESGPKMLILVSAAIDNTQDDFSAEDVIERARKEGITVNTINYKLNNRYNANIFRKISDKTNGLSFTANSSPDIKNAFGNCLDQRIAMEEEAELPQYVLSFTTSQSADGGQHQFEIQFAGTNEVVTYQAPNRDSAGGGFLQDYGIILIIMVGVLVGVGWWYMNEMKIRQAEEAEREAELAAERDAEDQRKTSQKEQEIQALREKNVRLQEQIKAKEQEIAKQQVIQDIPTVIPPEKDDLKNTKISGGGGAPIFMVAAGAFSKNYRLNKPVMTIGRSANNDIVIPEQTVSGKHASVTIEQGSFFLNDLGSTNGTFVNGSRVDKKILKSGDMIRVGAANCRFEI